MERKDNMNRIIFTLIYLFFTSSVIADRFTIFNKTYKEPWISLRNFETILKLSFPYARCCNVYIEGKYKIIKKWCKLDLFYNKVRTCFRYNT